MSVLPELLDAIIAAPEDDAPRRVYADALLDDGEVLGELIHLQLDLAGEALTRDERSARCGRERALLAEHAARWTAPIAALVPEATELGPVVPTARFRRGFVDEVLLDADTFAARGEELFALAPLLRGVGLEGMVDEDSFDWVLRKFRDAMSSPLLVRLHGMRCVVGSYVVHGFESRFAHESIIAEALPPFLDAIARMPQLRALAMFDPEDQLQPLIDAGLFARLDRLDLASFELANARAALDACPPGRLRSVALPWLDTPELLEILAHPKLEGVEELSLKRPVMDTELAPVFARLRALPKLRRLELADMRGAPVAPLALEELSLPGKLATTVFGWR